MELKEVINDLRSIANDLCNRADVETAGKINATIIKLRVVANQLREDFANEYDKGYDKGFDDAIEEEGGYYD